MTFGLDSLINDPLRFLAGALALVLSIGYHEFSHVFAAYSLGDMTGKNVGRLTLNPLKHLDPVGTMLIFLGAFIGWGRPAPFNPENLRYRRYGSALVALGGPASNLLLFAVFSLLLHWVYPTFGPTNLLTVFLGFFVLINASLLLFNLIPLPPLDGSWLLLALLPASARPLKEFIGRYGLFILFGLIIADFAFGIRLISPYLVNGVQFLSNAFGVTHFLNNILL
ncbi:MAG: site-2 protease family protein [Candidatus Kerfeldbacteria bacterium]|nr:site-2 protease family protein [Candidatus Kerfeldbacteria bacterium]